MRILGLDASTTTIGWSILEKDNNNNISLLHSGFFSPPKNGTIFERLITTRKFIINLINQHAPDEVVLEDIILFMAGKSTAQTTLTLAIFNRIIGLTIVDSLSKEPKMINVMSLRHTLKENNILPSKEEIPELVAKKLNIKFPYILTLKGKNKGKIAKESYDIADSIALAYGYLIKPELSIKKEKKKKKKKK